MSELYLSSSLVPILISITLHSSEYLISQNLKLVTRQDYSFRCVLGMKDPQVSLFGSM